MEQIKVIAREAFFVKKDSIGPKLTKALVDKHTHFFFQEKACQQCEWYEDRKSSETKMSEACDTCAAFLGGVGLCKEVKIGSNVYVSVPAGDKKGLVTTLSSKEIVFKSKRPDVPFKRAIKFTGTLKDFQEEAVQAICKKKYGVVKAPPRSGKTVLSTAAVCRIGKKTIIMAAQREWLDGFYETFCGSATQKPLTNARKDQVGFAKTLADFERLDVALVTYQTFNSEKGRALLAKVRDMWSVLIVDEIHMGAANKFATAISKLNTQYRVGLSGTPSRKDCVAAGTRVSMADGSSKPIEDVVIGDSVVCYDTERSKQTTSKVSNTFIRKKSPLVRVTINNTEIVCTPDHKFWCANRTEWVAAKDLEVEDTVVLND